MLLGNDISSWQGDVNYDVYKNNSNFIIVKATEGNGYRDPKLTRNQNEARRVGLLLGYYHFARPDLGNTPESEADYFLSQIWPVRNGEMLTLDYEPNWNGDAVGWCKRWLDRIKNRIGVKCPIYLNQSQVRAYNWKPLVDADYGLWIAAYTYDPNNNNFVTGAWPGAMMQQWTNRQQVPGASGGLDGNVFFGDVTAFKKYGYKTEVSSPSASVSPSASRSPSSSQSSSPSSSKSSSPSASPSPSMSPEDWEKKYNAEVVAHTATKKQLADVTARLVKVKNYVASA